MPTGRKYLSALWYNKEREKALSMVSEMMMKGIDPDEITYNALISSLCRDGMVDEAIAIFNSMESNGFMPSVITYNIVLLGLCKAHRMDDAISFLEEMVKRGCKPNQTTYILLVEGVGFAGRRAEAIYLGNSLFKMKVITEESIKRLKKTFPLPEENSKVCRLTSFCRRTSGYLNLKHYGIKFEKKNK